MSEVADAAAPSAGRLLREARERQGLHIAALAASIKVTPRKLELLEADRFDALPDATFTRALAQTVCRALKIDPAAVLVLLPPPAGHRLEQVGEGLNAPFRERPGVGAQRESAASGVGPVFWVTVLILAASAGLYFLPAGWLSLSGWRSLAQAPATGASAAAVGPAATSSSPSAVGATADSSVLGTSDSGQPVPPGAEPLPPGAEPIPPGAEPAAVAAPSTAASG
jgi:cytoskeleton protein RodZ